MQSKLTQRGTFGSVLSRVIEGERRIAEEIGEAARVELEQANEEFFAIMASKIVGAPAAPNLDGIRVPRWKPLSEKYLRRKQKRRHPNFYEFSGDFRRALNTMNAKTFLGRVSMQVANRAGTAPFSEGDISALRRGFRITLRLTGLNDVSESHPEAALRSQLAQYKLTNYQGRGDRTIFGPYIRWWTHVYLKYIVNRVT